MDWLDRISIWAIVILILSSFALISGHMGEARSDRNAQQRMTTVADNPAAHSEMDSIVKAIRNAIEGNNTEQAEMQLKELISKYPDEGEPHMLMGDTLMRKQDVVRAVREYKEAVDLNPDYLDKKSPLFQGKKLRVAVGEAVAEIEKKIKFNPADESVKSERKIIYYLQRKLAGSCG